MDITHILWAEHEVPSIAKGFQYIVSNESVFMKFFFDSFFFVGCVHGAAKKSSIRLQKKIVVAILIIVTVRNVRKYSFDSIAVHEKWWDEAQLVVNMLTITSLQSLLLFIFHYRTTKIAITHILTHSYSGSYLTNRSVPLTQHSWA